MRALLDTHALLWFLRSDPQLSAFARKWIETPNNDPLVSIASCWELAIKAGIKKLTLGESANSLLVRELPANRIGILNVSLEHAPAVEALPHHHRDPFDRMLVAQAMIERIPIISNDNQMDAYPVTRLW